ncbi:MAG TPA: L-rhamnose mutarotase [Gaiellaceae bacterium]|nr:L-rhamnose mutarotase [Gaiellaceae bacterium]
MSGRKCRRVRSAGIRNYAIFVAGTDVFGYLEADDLESAARRPASPAVSARWEDAIAGLREERVSESGPEPLE